MQINNWHDLKYVLAVKRAGSYSEAAKALQVDDTTVSRRINALQEKLDVQLFIRKPDGSLHISESGEAILDHLDSVENSVSLIETTLAATREKCVGTVRITSVPMVINRILAPSISLLLEHNPELNVVLIPDSKDLSLSYREADLAIRLARPSLGGSFVKARKIGQIHYSVYAAKNASSAQLRKLPWVTYDDVLAHIPPAVWTNKAITGDAHAKSQLKVHDVETALQITLAGSCKALLPDVVASREKSLKRVVIESAALPPSRSIWLLGHADQSKMRRIVATSDWIEDTINRFTMDSDQSLS